MNDQYQIRLLEARRTWLSIGLILAFVCYIFYIPLHLSSEPHILDSHRQHHEVGHDHHHHHDHDHGSSGHRDHPAEDHSLKLLQSKQIVLSPFLPFEENAEISAKPQCEVLFIVPVDSERPPSNGPPEPRQPRGPPMA